MGIWHSTYSLSPCPPPRLRLFQKFSTFRILVCGGDGSVGWVLSEIDALGLHKQVSWECLALLVQAGTIPSTGTLCVPQVLPSNGHTRVGGVTGALGGCSEPPHSVSLLQCQLGVLPLGTGNDLARVLGWGSLCDDDTQLLQILEKLERATTKMLDR